MYLNYSDDHSLECVHTTHDLPLHDCEFIFYKVHAMDVILYHTAFLRSFRDLTL